MTLRMQFAILQITSMLLMSCATRIPYNNEEFCALESRKFLSVEKQTSVIVQRNNIEHAPQIRHQTENVTLCVEPVSGTEKQRIQKLQAELAPKVQFNRSIVKFMADYEKAIHLSQEIGSRSISDQKQATFPKDE